MKKTLLHILNRVAAQVDPTNRRGGLPWYYPDPETKCECQHKWDDENEDVEISDFYQACNNRNNWISKRYGYWMWGQQHFTDQCDTSDCSGDCAIRYYCWFNAVTTPPGSIVNNYLLKNQKTIYSRPYYGKCGLNKNFVQPSGNKDEIGEL